MITTLKKYYLPFFLAFFVTTATKAFLKDLSIAVIPTLSKALVIGLFASLITGTIYYFQDTKWGPDKRKKLLKKSPFKDLLMNRFVEKDEAVVGTVNNYTVRVNYIWPNGVQAIVITAFFNPDSLSRYPGMFDDVKKRNRKSGLIKQDYTWTDASISYILSYNFTALKYQEVTDKINELINVLRAENLPPILLDEVDHTINDKKIEADLA